MERLEKELNSLKKDNTKLYATTRLLKQEVEQLNRNYIIKVEYLNIYIYIGMFLIKF